MQRLRSGFDELVVDPDGAVVVEDEDLQVDARTSPPLVGTISQSSRVAPSRTSCGGWR
jgi:hypothetical protein